MPIIRVQHNKTNPYFMLNRHAVNDDRLSFKAVGILTYLLSKPDGWMIQEENLVNQHTDGTTAVRSGLRELRDLGYIENKPVRDDQGKITKWESFVYEVPTNNQETLSNAHNDGNPHCGESTSGLSESLDSQDSGQPSFWETDPLVSNDFSGNKEKLEKKEKERKSANADSTRRNGLDTNNLPVDVDTLMQQKSRVRDGRAENTPERDKVLFGTEKSEPYVVRKAKELHQALSAKRKIFERVVSYQKWAGEFTKFLKTSSVTQKEFDETLNWYVEHIGEEFVPNAFSAEAFIGKFVNIREQMLMSQKSRNGVRKDGSIDSDSMARILERVQYGIAGKGSN